MKRIITLAALLLLAVTLLTGFGGCGRKTVLANLTPHELFELGKEKYDNRRYIDAQQHFQAIVYNYPGESIVDTAQYYLALSYFGAKEYELAQVEFNRLVLNYPSSVYFEHAIFMKAVSFFEGTPRHYGLDQTDVETAIKQFEDFIIDYPEAEKVDEARQYLLVARTRLAKKYFNSAVVYNRMGAYKAAEKYYQKVIDDYTDTEFAPRATFYIAEMAYKQRRYDDASKGYEGFVAVFLEHELADEARRRAAEAAYKAGEKAFDRGDFATARERFESFVRNYPQHKKVDKAEEILHQIDQLAPVDGKGEDANS
ncbi:MAG: outer membrane protein assembly factor BamD [Candidatus Zixiibacteriota bacterium]|nr:MAG: outer membrane protein assembly factor BamD [candidate division Zixibacteria bacterium]